MQEFFGGQAAKYETDLRDVQNRLSEFSSRNELTSIAEQKQLLAQKLLDAESSLKETEISLAESGNRVTELCEQLDAQAARVVTQKRAMPNQYSVERLNTMLAEFENRRTEALMKFRSSDRIVTEIDQEIANTRGALERASTMVSTEESSDVNPLRTGIQSDLDHEQLQEGALRVRRAGIAGTIASYRAHLAQLEQATVENDTLERRRKESEENYLLYARKEEEARIADSLDRQKMANIAVAEVPVSHYLPARPPVGLNLAIGVILAAILSLGAAVALEHGGGKLHTPAEFETTTGFPVLATVGWKQA